MEGTCCIVIMPSALCWMDVTQLVFCFCERMTAQPNRRTVFGTANEHKNISGTTYYLAYKTGRERSSKGFQVEDWFSTDTVKKLVCPMQSEATSMTARAVSHVASAPMMESVCSDSEAGETEMDTEDFHEADGPMSTRQTSLWQRIDHSADKANSHVGYTFISAVTTHEDGESKTELESRRSPITQKSPPIDVSVMRAGIENGLGVLHHLHVTNAFGHATRYNSMILSVRLQPVQELPANTPIKKEIASLHTLSLASAGDTDITSTERYGLKRVAGVCLTD
ncbi:hypothetical protein J6590_056592 [Homalodisca vitripennis]|nr:hypothetical protein J6590_056592 [Homalodisca vitripennis]